MERREPNASRNYRDIGCILTEPQSPPHEDAPEEDQDRLQRQDQPQRQIETHWEESDPDCVSVAVPPHEDEPEGDQDRLQRQHQPQSQIESDSRESDLDCVTVAVEAVLILGNCRNRVDLDRERRLLATKRLGYMALSLLMRDACRCRRLLRDGRA